MRTLKVVLALAGLWLLAGFGWLAVTAIGGAVTEHERGAAVTAAMFASWGAALVLGLAASLGAKLALWRWLPAGGPRLALLLAFVALAGATGLLECFMVLIIFNR